MARRHKRRAAERRAELIAKLGGKCKCCGSTEDLEIDHINGRTWNLREKSSDVRIAIYEREAKQGLLQILCKPCNASKGGHGYPKPTKRKRKKGKP